MTEKKKNMRITLDKPFLCMKMDVGTGVKVTREKEPSGRACVTVCTGRQALTKDSLFANSSNGSHL